jgi:hypothetical protein
VAQAKQVGNKSSEITTVTHIERLTIPKIMI